MRPIAPLHHAIVRFFQRGNLFARDERGVTAIEFGLLGVPFFAIIGAILETALVFLSSQILDSALQDSSRLVRTGRAQESGYTAAQYKTAICSNLFGLFKCDQLKVRVRIINNFNSGQATSPVFTEGPDAGKWNIAEEYTPGGGSSIVMVEAYYKWPITLSLGGFSLQNQPDGTRLLGSVRVFRNEPF